MAERLFIAKPPEAGPVPLLIGLEGPPGGGKTCSGHRLMAGIKRVRKGPVVVIDTEAGRAKKFKADFDFLHVDFPPPFTPSRFWQAIEEQLHLDPAAIMIDSGSDEHEGEGGVLEWHDRLVREKAFGDNSQYAWGPPKADRKALIGRMLRVKVPLLWTFRARERTTQEDDPNRRGKKRVVSMGYVPVAPLEIVHALDLVCLLPARANGVAEWSSQKLGEDFALKLPDYLRPHVQEGQLNEATGEALARWAAGGWATQPGTLGLGTDQEVRSLREEIEALLRRHHQGDSAEAQKSRGSLLRGHLGVSTMREFKALPVHKLREGLNELQLHLEGAPMDREFDDAQAEADEERAAIQAAG